MAGRPYAEAGRGAQVCVGTCTCTCTCTCSAYEFNSLFQPLIIIYSGSDHGTNRSNFSSCHAYVHGI